MSKLPNAPLNEVIFELKWEIKNKGDLQKNQYLHGDLHAELKSKYPMRELLVPPEVPYEALIGKPTHRFRKKKNSHPLYQVGPGLITFNTIDKFYFWNEFQKDVDEIIDKFIFTEVFSNVNVLPGLHYIDVFQFDFEKDNIEDFINQNFNVKYNQSFLRNTQNASNINLGFHYPFDLGELGVIFQRGRSGLKGEGLLMQTNISGKPMKLNKKDISSWLTNAHELCSQLFKDITKDDIFESFKKEIK